MASTVIKNWDNKTWLSSKDYIKKFNSFLAKNIKIHSKSEILDIGCGRGKILGSLSSKLKLNHKPIGIDLVNHTDKDKRISFRKINALSFFSVNKKKYDLILIKQTIHLLKLKEIKILLSKMSNSLTPHGKILIFTLDPHKNEIPTFELMKTKLLKSLNRDIKILNFISKLYPKRIIKKFSYKVKITKRKYVEMVLEKFISTLLNFNNDQIVAGVKEINQKYKKNLKFEDKLICIIIKNN